MIRISNHTYSQMLAPPPRPPRLDRLLIGLHLKMQPVGQGLVFLAGDCK